MLIFLSGPFFYWEFFFRQAGFNRFIPRLWTPNELRRYRAGHRRLWDNIERAKKKQVSIQCATFSDNHGTYSFFESIHLFTNTLYARRWHARRNKTRTTCSEWTNEMERERVTEWEKEKEILKKIFNLLLVKTRDGRGKNLWILLLHYGRVPWAKAYRCRESRALV